MNETHASDATSRILIVTGDSIQLRLAAGLLKLKGHKVDSAEDCTAALAALADKSFDVVLIDVTFSLSALQSLVSCLERQQPAPRAIGMSLDGEYPTEIAFAGQIQVPATADAFYEVLEASHSPRSEDLTIDLSEASRRIPGGMAGVRDLADVMLRETPRFLDEIDQGLAEGDFSQAERGAHSLKGAANVFGARAVASAAAQLERSIKDRELKQVALQVEKLQVVAQRLVDALREVVSGE